MPLTVADISMTRRRRPYPIHVAGDRSSFPSPGKRTALRRTPLTGHQKRHVWVQTARRLASSLNLTAVTVVGQTVHLIDRSNPRPMIIDYRKRVVVENQFKDIHVVAIRIVLKVTLLIRLLILLNNFENISRIVTPRKSLLLNFLLNINNLRKSMQ